MTVGNESAWLSIMAATAVKSMAVLGAAWLAALALRRRPAAARHLVWTAAWVAVLALPLLSLTLPPLGVPVRFLPASVVFQATSAAGAEARAGQTRTMGRATAPLESEPWRPDWARLLMLVWAGGSAVALARMAAGWAAIGRLRRRAKPYADPELALLRQRLGIRDFVDVLEIKRGSMPMTFGLVRPAIFLPADAAAWSPERRRLVLLHELAHVRRCDVATHMLARAALNLYWWNPLAWAAWKEFLKERERAADDLVLSAGTRAPDYAGHLLEIARTMQSPRAAGWAAVAMARRSELESRLASILDSKVNRKAPGRAWALAAALAAVSVAVPLAILRAQDKPAPAFPADVEATIRAAAAERNPGMLEDAAKAADAMRHHDLAQKLLESSLAIRADVSGPRSAEYALGLVKLGQFKRRRGQREEAGALYRQALSVLGNRPEAAPALFDLGTEALRNEDIEQAVDYFERARAADPGQAGRALMWMAVSRQRQKNVEEAESLFRRAIEIQDSNAPEAAITMTLYSQFLRRQGREDEANSIGARGIELRRALGAQAPARDGGLKAYRAGVEASAPTLVSKVEPSYSEEAKIAGYQGTVVIYAEIASDGLAHNLRVVRGLGLGLDEKAIEAISQWRFKPGTKDGQPVTVVASIEVNFKLL